MKSCVAVACAVLLVGCAADRPSRLTMGEAFEALRGTEFACDGGPLSEGNDFFDLMLCDRDGTSWGLITYNTDEGLAAGLADYCTSPRQDWSGIPVVWGENWLAAPTESFDVAAGRTSRSSIDTVDREGYEYLAEALGGEVLEMPDRCP
jgi:hypothetical protein